MIHLGFFSFLIACGLLLVMLVENMKYEEYIFLSNSTFAAGITGDL